MKEKMSERKIDRSEQTENPNAGHRQRVRERFRKVGFNGMQDYEKLELLLLFAIPRKDTKQVAKDLLKRFGDIARVLEATEDQLLQVKGLTPNAALLIRTIIPLIHEYHAKDAAGNLVSDSDKCGELLCERYKGVMDERVTVVCTDSSCRVLAAEYVCDGDVSSVMINCRRLVEIVLKYPKTAGVIIAHNHPGGIALPSRSDVSSTTEIVKTLRCMGITVVDHIIVADDTYVSMANSMNFKNLFQVR